MGRPRPETAPLETAGLNGRLSRRVGGVNPATEFIERSKSWSPHHAFVADHGDTTPKASIEHTHLGGHHVAVAAEPTDGERRLVADAVREIEPVRNACFANALRMWRRCDRLGYAEGFAIDPETGLGIEHAWCLLDGGRLVDVTVPFAHYYGVAVTEEDALRRHASEPDASHGIIGDHRSRFAFFRERGYLAD